MTLQRFKLLFRSLNRVPELWRCLANSRAPLREILGYLEIKPLAYPYTLRLKSGLTIQLDDWADLTTAWVVFYGGEYEVRPGDQVIVDLGANYGMFSLHAATLAPKARIIAVEPFPATFQRLQQTIRDNGLEDRVTAVQAAAVGSAREVQIDDNPELPSHARKISDGGGVRVEGVTVPILLKRYGLEKVDLLKVDIEGAEYELFQNLTPDSLQAVARIGLEYHEGQDPQALFQLIESLGYRPFRHPKKGEAGVIEFERRD